MIRLNNVSYIYQSGAPFEKTALNNISLHIEQGSFVGLIGHTGSGKSTLIQLINGLLKPTAGEVIIDGESLSSPDIDKKQIHFKVGLVMQYPEYQLFEETVYKDISFGPSNMELSADEIDQRVREAAQMVGISEQYLDISPFELSGGQKRRAAIAGVLAMKPKVLILDEPTAGLDPLGQHEILANIAHLHQSTNTTVILVSHNMEEIAKLATNIIVLNKGSVALTGTPDKVFANPELLTKIGLSVPQITTVAEKLRANEIPISDSIYTVEKLAQELLPLL